MQMLVGVKPGARRARHSRGARHTVQPKRRAVRPSTALQHPPTEAHNTMQPGAVRASTAYAHPPTQATHPPTHADNPPTHPPTRVVLQRGQRPDQVGQVLAREVVGGRGLQQAARHLGGDGRHQALRRLEKGCWLGMKRRPGRKRWKGRRSSSGELNAKRAMRPRPCWDGRLCV